jgi:hypothetical protein
MRHPLVQQVAALPLDHKVRVERVSWRCGQGREMTVADVIAAFTGAPDWVGETGRYEIVESQSSDPCQCRDCRRGRREAARRSRIEQRRRS